MCIHVCTMYILLVCIHLCVYMCVQCTLYMCAYVFTYVYNVYVSACVLGFVFVDCSLYHICTLLALFQSKTDVVSQFTTKIPTLTSHNELHAVYS